MQVSPKTNTLKRRAFVIFMSTAALLSSPTNYAETNTTAAPTIAPATKTSITTNKTQRISALLQTAQVETIYNTLTKDIVILARTALPFIKIGLLTNANNKLKPEEIDRMNVAIENFLKKTEDYFQWDKVSTTLKASYDIYLTDEDITALEYFYSKPVVKKLIALETDLIKPATKAIQQILPVLVKMGFNMPKGKDAEEKFFTEQFSKIYSLSAYENATPAHREAAKQFVRQYAKNATWFFSAGTPIDTEKESTNKKTDAFEEFLIKHASAQIIEKLTIEDLAVLNKLIASPSIQTAAAHRLKAHLNALETLGPSMQEAFMPNVLEITEAVQPVMATLKQSTTTTKVAPTNTTKKKKPSGKKTKK